MKLFVALAGALGASAVAAGAFGAHALAERLEPRMLEVWDTAARYQMYHALALFAVAWLVTQTQHISAQIAGWAFVGGTLFFSGSLYVLALSGIKWLGAITPLGGVMFIGGWIACIVAATRIA